MQKMLEYSQLLHNQIGKQYLIILILFALVVRLLYRLQHKEQHEHNLPWLFVLVTMIVLISPISYLFVMKLHIGPTRAESVFFVLPVIPVAALAIIELYSLGKQYTKYAGILMVAFVLLISSQPWKYTKENIVITGLTGARIGREIAELAELMPEGGAVVPPEIHPYLREANPNLRLQPEGIDGSDYNEGISYIVEHDYDYYVVQAATVDEQWLAELGFERFGETGQYYIYRHVK